MRYFILTIIAAAISIIALIIVAININNINWHLSSMLWNIVAVCLWLRGEKNETTYF